MHILIAEDNEFSRTHLEGHLVNFGHTFRSCLDGKTALAAFQDDPAVDVAILDWIMPSCSGLDVCRAIKTDQARFTYVMMLTVKKQSEEVAEALDAGADDFVSKPFSPLELRAKIEAGGRIIRLHRALTRTIAELEATNRHVEQLEGIIPICAGCKRIRNEANEWMQMDKYLEQRTNSQFSHSMCPICLKEHYPEF